MPVHIAPVQSAVRWYLGDAEAGYKNFEKWTAILTVSWLDTKAVFLSGLDGRGNPVTRKMLSELAVKLMAHGIERAYAVRKKGRRVMYSVNRYGRVRCEESDWYV